MKIFENRSILKKILIVLVIVLVASFCFSGEVQADDDAVGGKLLSPIIDLLVFIGDSFMNIIHGVIYGQWNSTINVDLTTTILGIIATIAVGIIAAVIVAALVVFTAGAVVAAAAAAGVTLSAIGVGTVLVVSVTGGVAAAAVFNSNVLPDVIELPVYQISPENIFSNEVLLFDVDFFNPKQQQVAKDANGNVLYDENGNPVYWKSTADQLRTTISNWYNILRDISVVVLLSILVYVGIRIIISSTSNDKAKYKQMLMDWVVAICLLFVMQYIMSFSNLIVGKATEVISDLKYDNGYFSLVEDKDKKIEEKLTDLGYDVSSLKVTEGGVNYINWRTNLLGVARLNAQMAKEENATYAGYGIIFLVLVLFTIYFIFTYLRRVLYMAFLTLIAPLVAMTYPIDKINDGKAQAFDRWFKEYIFNLLIQPVHLILYTILVSSAFELASTNIIYSLVALGFMMPAEKLLRKFFGFEKADTPGLLAGAAGAALMMSGMNKLIGKGSRGAGKSSSGNDKKSDSTTNEKPPRINSEFDKDGSIFNNESNLKIAEGEGAEQRKREDLNKNSDKAIENENIQEDNSRYKAPYSDEEIDDINESLGISDYVNRNPYSEDDLNEIYGYNDLDEGNTNRLNTVKDIDQNNNEQENDSNMPGTIEIPDQDNDENKGIQQREQESKPIDSSRDKNTGKEKKESTAMRMLKAAGRGGLASTRYYARGASKQLKNKIKNIHPVQSAARFTAGAAGAAALGAAGLAIGITSGDASKAAQYTAAGVMGGYGFTTGMVNRANSQTPERAQEIAERSAFRTDEEYENRMQEKYVKQYQKNADNIFELERKYGKKEATRIMEKDVPTLIDNGITDMKDIITIEDMIKDEKINVDNLNEGIAVKKYASRIGEDSTKMTAKKRDEWKKTFSTEFSKKKKYDRYDHNDMADTVLDKVDAFNKIRTLL